MPTLAHLIHKNYQTQPQKTAIVLQHAGQEDKLVSYHDLVLGSAQYARTYAHEGIQPGEVVVLILQHGADLVYAFWERFSTARFLPSCRFSLRNFRRNVIALTFLR